MKSAFVHLSKPVVSLEFSLTQKTKTTQPKLSIIWVKEFDGEHQRLVARWVTQD
jgi:hypothetical protein